jgi:DNA modification methylase
MATTHEMRLTKTKHLDPSWDFKSADTKIHTHCFHNYPAMMIPQVAGRLIDNYGENSQLLFDPYCGTGTSLVEANLRNISAVGTDLNPLARLIAQAKTTPLDIKTLDLHLKNFNDAVSGHEFGIRLSSAVDVPDFPNIDYWFSKEVRLRLALLKAYIANIDDLAIQNFFKVAFSETIRESSWTRNSEFKLLRMPLKQIAGFKPEVIKIMALKLSRNRNGLASYLKAKNNHSAGAKVFSFNTVESIPEAILPEGSVDLIVTSPPYGDSRTTVAYGQFSRLANQWLDFENAATVDKELMGGRRAENGHYFDIAILDETINQISRQDEKRSKDVVAFFKDYERSVKNIAKVVRRRGHVCYVVGNRRVKNVAIPTDEITGKLFEKYGFRHRETIMRNIPNKRMPLENSPSNIAGEKSPTMKNEYIVICRKS